MELWERKLRHYQGIRHSNATLAITRGIKEPNVMSPQSHPRDMGIDYWMKNDQLSDKRIFSSHHKIHEHMHAEHLSYKIKDSSCSD